MGRCLINKENRSAKHYIPDATNWCAYFREVQDDFREMKKIYPFSNLCILPTVKPEIATARVIAANNRLIEVCNGKKSDFLGDYTRELLIIIPVGYREKGCDVYGGKWIDLRKLKDEDYHFHYQDGQPFQTRYGYRLCVGTPESFPLMRNVILESVRTAENMLIAYERIMIGESNHLEVIAYGHGDVGRVQFNNNTHKYLPSKD